MQNRHYWPFIAVGITHLLCILINPSLAPYSKPFLIPLLALGFGLGRIRRKRVSGDHILFAALFFSWLGDLLMMQSTQDLYFMAGIGSFFIAQISFMRLFYRRPSLGLQVLRNQYIPIVLFVLYWVMMLIYLWPQLAGPLRFPIAAYSAVLVGMGIFAYAVKEKSAPSKQGMMVLIGALLFIISDSLIALDRFSDMRIWNPQFSIMITYIMAQGLIVYGIEPRSDTDN